ncbi:MAG: nickel pincer cofactor biosynthesis protein LarB [Methanosarcinales archaeon]|nr:nickel pincer cofactor biosynthesis protein LarB [Methanosarcinales archaeon]
MPTTPTTYITPTTSHTSITSVLTRIKENEITIDEAEAQIQLLRFKEISRIARIDDQRAERTGVPEAILAEGKSSDDLVRIVQACLEGGGRILITRVSDAQIDALRSGIDPRPQTMEWSEQARTLVCARSTAPPEKTGGRIGIITAGTADIPVAEEARVMADEMGCDVEMIYDAGAAGIHRLFPDLGNLIAKGVDAIVVAAGRDGTLPTVVAGLVPVPVIGLPVSVGYGAGGKGEAALLSMLQSCSVLAVVNIDAGFVAGAFAARIANLAAAAITSA